MKKQTAEQIIANLELSIQLSIENEARSKRIASLIHELIKVEIHKESERLDGRINEFHAGYPGYD